MYTTAPRPHAQHMRCISFIIFIIFMGCPCCIPPACHPTTTACGPQLSPITTTRIIFHVCLPIARFTQLSQTNFVAEALQKNKQLDLICMYCCLSLWCCRLNNKRQKVGRQHHFSIQIKDDGFGQLRMCVRDPSLPQTVTLCLPFVWFLTRVMFCCVLPPIVHGHFLIPCEGGRMH